jgi:hypothetical protein
MKVSDIIHHTLFAEVPKKFYWGADEFKLRRVILQDMIRAED